MFNFLRTWMIKGILNVNAKKMNIYRLPDRIYLISEKPVKRINIKFKDRSVRKFKLPLDKK